MPFSGDSQFPRHPQHPADPAAGQQPPHPAERRQPQEPDAAAEDSLFVNNSIEHVAEDVFQGTEKVTIFDISHNLLTSLPPDSSSTGKAWKMCGSPTTSCCMWTTSCWNEPLGNPFQCDCQLLPFLQYLNSTKTLWRDKDPCTPSHNGTNPASPPNHCLDSCQCSCTNDNFIFVDCSSSGLTHLPPLFTEEQVVDVNETRCGPDVPNSPGLAERAIWLLTDLELCPDNTGIYISMAFEFSEKDIDRNKEFDAFISFSHKDQDFVIMELIKSAFNLLPRVEVREI
ncbi:hypothetical protein CEXT_716161 [Caerostris extrusa]|uniref:Uncharacterized protein n=1 Tax=Caerostris extrusa TaxID=172846 RepID=A0AAV4PXT2_CAEEX|nr:hypothetical protein CEXT_716161 [Caerostris extrusa]